MGSTNSKASAAVFLRGKAVAGSRDTPSYRFASLPISAIRARGLLVMAAPLRLTSSLVRGKDGETRAILAQRRWDMNRPTPSMTIHSLSMSRPRSPKVAC